MSRKTVIYQMLPRLWGNGKLKGIDGASLDYLKSLGVTHVWYTGIIRHSTRQPFVKGDPGSPYAISNYYDVNEYLSVNPADRMHEFDLLVKRTHNAGLKLVIDFVPNHTGRDYADGRGGIPHCDHYDYDWSDTLKIDYGHRDTYGKMLDIIRFWAARGVDGFRCDMVELVPAGFFKWLISSAKSEYPDLTFIAEVYQKEKYRQYVDEVGFDLLYDKSGLYDTIRAIVAGYGSAKGITWNWQFLQDLQPHMLNFLENHDEQRLASPWFAGKPDRMDALYASLMLNTAPFMLYFGQEIGLDAAEGHEGRTSIFEWNRPEALSRLYAFIHGKDSLDNSELKLLSSYRSALSMAAETYVSEGLSFDLCYCQDSDSGFSPDRHFAFIRHSEEKTVLFVCNFGDSSADMTVKIPQHASDYLGRRLEHAVRVSVAPFGCAVTYL